VERIFGTKRDEVTGEWKKNVMRSYCVIIHYFAGNKIEKNEMSGACSADGRGVYRALVGKPEGKGPLGRTRGRWEDNIRWIFKKWDVGYGLD
jgi:hypothetical protein